MTEQANLTKHFQDIRARDIMSRFAITIREHESVTNLAHLMMRFKISGVPVVSSNGAISGIVTATDLFNLMKSTSHAESFPSGRFEQMTVQELMTKNVVVIEEETSLLEIISIMCERDIHTLPVLGRAEKEIVGVIGRRDILNAFYVGPDKGK